MNARYSPADNAYTAHVDTFARDRLPPREQWPEFRFDLPELHYPPRLNCASVLLDDAILEGHGARVALYSQSGNWSYFELLERANRIANVLVRDLGVVPGNRVLLRGANTPTLVASWLAVMKVGAIAVTTMPMLRAKELVVIFTAEHCTTASLSSMSTRVVARPMVVPDGLDKVTRKVLVPSLSLSLRIGIGTNLRRSRGSNVSVFVTQV